MAVWYLAPQYFLLTPFHGPGIPASQAKTLLQPFLNTLHDLKINYTMTGPQDFPTYLDEYNAFQLPVEVNSGQYGGRLIPRSVVADNNDGLVAAVRNIIEDKVAKSMFVGLALNANQSSVRGNANVNNAVLPAWREALIEALIVTLVDSLHCGRRWMLIELDRPWNYSAPRSYMVALQRRMTEVFIPQLEAVSPGSGSYLNEVYLSFHF